MAPIGLLLLVLQEAKFILLFYSHLLLLPVLLPVLLLGLVELKENKSLVSITERIGGAGIWRIFETCLERISLNQNDKVQPYSGDYGSGYAYRPDRTRLRIPNERSIISSIYTRLSIDVASIAMRHIRQDDQDRYQDDINSGLNNCLTVEANLDQAAQAFRIDMALTLFDKGVVAIVPIDTTLNPITNGGYDILTMRVGEVVQWYPEHVQLWLYNQATGYRQLITLPKTVVAIVENPLYAVMNEPNSTLQRLLYKLNLLDAVDDQSASGKLES